MSEIVIAPLCLAHQTRPHGQGSTESGTVAGWRCWLGVRVLVLPLLLLPLVACAPPSNETGAAFTQTGEIIAMGGGEGGPANACFTCHGLDGAGDGVSVPRLAGLDAGYLQKQMEDYAKDVRQDVVMREVARWLDDGDRRAVAQFYADMPAPPARAPASPPPAIYLIGDAEDQHYDQELARAHPDVTVRRIQNVQLSIEEIEQQLANLPVALDGPRHA